MKEPKRRHGLNGTVLIMILTVMAVLIIMLMATLTVVTTANQRIYTKFEENQAYYTARSALDVFTNQMLDDSKYYAYDGSSIRPYKYTDTSGATPTIGTANMKQGLGLQGELYKIKSQGLSTAKIAAAHDASFRNGSGEPTPSAYEALGFVENILESDNVFGTVGGASAPENAFFSVSNTATNDVGTKDFIIYHVTLPEMGNGTDSYGRFVDSDATTGAQVATIKVEVLDRVFNTNPTYTTEDMIDIIKSGTTAQKDALKLAIKNGDRTKDKLRIKITSTVEFMGIEGTSVLIYDSYERKQISTSRAVTSLSDMSQGSGMFPIGGASALHGGTIKFADDSISTGSIYVTEGNFAATASNKINIGGSDIFYVKKNFSVQNGYPIIKQNGATIFIGGDFNTGGANGDIGSAGAKANMIVGGAFTIGGANFGQFYGNIYCNLLNTQNADGSEFTNASVYTNRIASKITSNMATAMDYATNTLTVDLEWATVPANVYYSSTDLYAVKTEEQYINYWPVEKTITTTVVKFDPVLWGGIARTTTTYINEGTNTETVTEHIWGNLVVNNVTGTALTAPTCSAFNLDVEDYTTNAVGADMQRTFNLPANMIPAPGAAAEPKVVVPTIAYLYGEFFDPSAFNANGGFDFTPSSPTLTDAQIDAEFTAFLDSKVITSEQKLGGVTTLDKYSNYVSTESRNPTVEAGYPAAQQIPSAFSRVINTSGRLKTVDQNGNASGANSENYGLVAIDARSGPIELQMGYDGATGESYYSGKFVVFGDNEVTFLMAGNQKINIGGPTGSCVFEVYTPEMYNTPSLNLGSTSNPTAPPKINFYAASTVPKVGFGHQSFTAGYYYMPLSIFDLAGGMNGKQFNTTYDGYGLGNVAYGVVGSVLCKGYTSSQKVGVAYISNNASTTNMGDPYLSWQANRYSRH